jgi:hypothetical protein
MDHTQKRCARVSTVSSISKVMIPYLSETIRNEILSYGDVDITQKFKQVLCQLEYHSNEFKFQLTINRPRRNSRRVRYRRRAFRHFILDRSRQKKLFNHT